MLDYKIFIENKDAIIKKLSSRGQNYSKNINDVIVLIQKRNQLITKIDNLKAQKNQLSKKKSKPSISEIRVNIELKKEIIALQKILVSSNTKIDNILHWLPNIPKFSNISTSELVYEWSPPKLANNNVEYWKILEDAKFINNNFANNLSGSNFIVYTNKGAKFKRELTNYLLNFNIKAGYIEIDPPILLLKDNLFNTGQLPKFENDLYKIDDFKYLSPTAEVQLVNLYKNQILNTKDLPLKLTALTSCFRREAGAAGSKTKGNLRIHQFSKIELVNITNSSNSHNFFLMLIEHVKKLLQSFNFKFRILKLPPADIAFSAAYTYDFEIWFPASQKFIELSSCSNCFDFQARRAKIRYISNNGNKYAHTLNCSSLAIDRLISALLEYYGVNYKF